MNKHQWNEWYAWKPIRMKGKWVWLRKVYRIWNPIQVRYHYGTLFDVIETTGNNQARPLEPGELFYIPRPSGGHLPPPRPTLRTYSPPRKP